jgi:hypothetical protein
VLMPLSMRPSRPLAPLDNICVAELAPEMTTRVAAVLPVPRAQFHKTEPQPATALPAEARAQLERPCAMVPASHRAPLAPEPAQQERIHATASAWPPATSPAVARRARRVHSRPGPHKPPAMVPSAGSYVRLGTMLVLAPARVTTAHRHAAPPVQRVRPIPTELQLAWQVPALSLVTPATTTAALRANVLATRTPRVAVRPARLVRP